MDNHVHGVVVRNREPHDHGMGERDVDVVRLHGVGIGGGVASVFHPRHGPRRPHVPGRICRPQERNVGVKEEELSCQ